MKRDSAPQPQTCDLHKYLAPFLLIYFAPPEIFRGRAGSAETVTGQFISEDLGQNNSEDYNHEDYNMFRIPNRRMVFSEDVTRE